MTEDGARFAGAVRGELLSRRSFGARLAAGATAGLVISNSTAATMNTKTIIRPAKGAAPVGPYNHAVRWGSLLLCSGQIPLDPATGQLVAGDIRVQTERVLENIRLLLEDQGLNFGHVLKSTVFMTNLGEFGAMNEVYARYFTGDFPARSTVQVAALPRGAAVEIEVIAGIQ